MLDSPAPTKVFEIDRGEFHCPNCRCKSGYRRYERAEIKRLLFFRIKGDTVETFLVCDKCERRMKDEDLRGNLPRDTRAILSALKEKLRAGESVQKAITTLIEAGMAEDEARRLVNTAAGIALRRCKQCSLTYVDTVSACAKCGHLLPS